MHKNTALALGLLVGRRLKQQPPPDPVPFTGDFPIFSSALIENGAAGMISLFTVPQGQPIIHWRGPQARFSTLVYDETTTSMRKAGELGGGVRSATIRAVKFDFPEGVAVINRGEFNTLALNLKIANKSVFSTHLGALPAAFDPVKCSPYDTLQVCLSTPSGKSLRLRGPPTLLRVTLDAKVERAER